MLSGNKGEWAEVYTLIKLLADGKLYAADEELEKLEDIFYPIIRIIRDEIIDKNTLSHKEYEFGNSIKIYEEYSNKPIVEIPKELLSKKKLRFFDLIKGGKGKSFKLPESEELLESLKINKLKAKSLDKADIKIIVHDLNTGKKPELGFSIKSLIGKDSTLFNPGPGTNFIYKITPPDGSQLDITEINKSSLQEASHKNSKITLRIKKLLEKGCEINFHRIQSENLNLNLSLIDSRLPEILSFLLFYKYLFQENSLSNLCDLLNKENPINYNLSKEHPFYKYKIKNFLTDSALGMTPETKWEGIYDATGGIILVKDSGDVLCYHIYNRNQFQKYLFTHTRLEQAATGEDKDNPGNISPNPKSKKFYFGWIYEEKNEYFIKLNLQVRFKK